MSSHTTISCDADGCTSRLHTSASDVAHPPQALGWVTRALHDTVHSSDGGNCQVSGMLHYCPSCARQLTPPLTPGLRSALEAAVATRPSLPTTFSTS